MKEYDKYNALAIDVNKLLPDNKWFEFDIFGMNFYVNGEMICTINYNWGYEKIKHKMLLLVALQQ